MDGLEMSISCLITNAVHFLKHRSSLLLNLETFSGSLLLIETVQIPHTLVTSYIFGSFSSAPFPPSFPSLPHLLTSSPHFTMPFALQSLVHSPGTFNTSIVFLLLPLFASLYVLATSFHPLGVNSSIKLSSRLN